MALIPGRHLATSKSARPVTPDKKCWSSEFVRLVSVSTTATCESLASISGGQKDRTID